MGSPSGVVPGNEEGVDLDPAVEAAETIESAGDDERGVGGAEDFVFLR